MNAGLATETVGARTKVRERHPPSERGVRVRVYPNAEQVPALVARGRARAQANDEDAQGLAIKCTRAALSDEVKRVQRNPAYRWLRDTLPLWSCLQVVKQTFAARERAFARGCGHPRRRGFRASAPMSFCISYDGRRSDKDYVPNRRFHIPAIGVLKIRTGRGHMPEVMIRNPTVTVPGRAEATTKPACASSDEDNGGAGAPSSTPAGAGTPRDGPAAGGLDGGAHRGHEERSI